MLEVVAGVLRDAGGRVLLAQRGSGSDFAGRWEFPGGKREPGEAPEEALRRELHEELGIDIGGLRPLIAVPQANAGKRIRLDVYDVVDYRGEPHGREAQALSWVAPKDLSRHAMPPADLPVVAALLAPASYAITPEPDGDPTAFMSACQRLLDSGVRRLQLRAPQADADMRARLAQALLPQCQTVGAELLVNADVALARALGIGLHLRSAQLRAFAARPLPEALPLAASCHDAEELQLAKALGVDFVVLGPVRATASHPDAQVLGWAGFAALREQSDLPIYALGGLRPDDLAQARAHGAQGIAGIRGFWG